VAVFPAPIRKKNMRLRVKARIASKVREKDLLEKAKALMEDPELILPECAEDCGSCPFRKTRARLERISRVKDDPGKLAKYAKSGDKLARAYAATIGLVHEEKAPYLASAKYPGGTITFALRGRTTKEKLIGVQNFDSPKWRVLSVLDLVKKKGLHFYSFGDDFVCTGRYARPPDEYVEHAARSVGATRPEEGAYACPHAPSSGDHIDFDWKTSGKKVLLCDQCAAKNKNTLRKLGEGMAVPDTLSEFDIWVERPLRQVAGKGGCKDLLRMPVDRKLLDEYQSGTIGDRELIEQHLESVKSRLEEKELRVYVLSDRCFGDDLDAFVREVAKDEVEEKALRGILSEVDHPIVVDRNTTVNNILSRFWASHGMSALLALVPEGVAKKHYSQAEESVASPLKSIRRAIKDAADDLATSRMPRYEGLSQYGAFADSVVRAYKTGGGGRAVSLIDANTSTDHRIRSMSHAFYLALGVNTKSWKFKDEEREFGKHLAPLAKVLMETKEVEAHHKAFSQFLQAAGCTEQLTRA